MRMEIVERVQSLLQAAGITAVEAYPGQAFPGMTAPVAAVHLASADRETAAVEVQMLCPAGLGGVACEAQALKVIACLAEAGAVCTQTGCRYDSLAQVFSVPVRAVFNGQADAGLWEPGFSVLVNGSAVPDAVRVTAEETAAHRLEYSLGQTLPQGISLGKAGWSIRLEEKVSPGAQGCAGAAGEFTLEVLRGGLREKYTGCRWISQHRAWTREGLYITYQGIALSGQEEQSE